MKRLDQFLHVRIAENKLQQHQVWLVKADNSSVDIIFILYTILYRIEAGAGVSHSGIRSLKQPRRLNTERATGPGDVCCLMWAPLTNMTKLLGTAMATLDISFAWFARKVETIILPTISALFWIFILSHHLPLTPFLTLFCICAEPWQTCFDPC